MDKARNKLYRLLRWSEKYTKTDMLYLAKGGFWLTFGKIFTAVIILGLAVAFANLLPKETYGQYKYILSIISLLSIPTLTGMGEAVTRSVARGFDGTTLAALSMKIRWGLLGSIASIAVAAYYFLNDNYLFTVAFLITALFIPLIDTLAIFHNALHGKKSFKVSTIYGVVIQTVSVITMITTIFLTNNLFAILLAYFIPYVTMRGIFFRRTLVHHTTNKEIDPEALSYGKHLSFLWILTTISGNLDKILLWHFLGAVPVAIYSFAGAPIVQVRSIFNNIFTLAYPKFAARNISEIKKTIYRKMFIFLLILIPVTFGYILVAPYLFQFLFPQYMEGVWYSQLIALMLLLMPKNLIASVMSAHAQKKNLYISNIIVNISRLVLLVLLVPLFGITGAISALIGAQFIHGVLVFYGDWPNVYFL